MTRIKVKNFGPIREGYVENDGWLDIKKVTVFIGNQGSGKSTLAKLFSTLSWLEKSMYRKDLEVQNLKNDFFLDKLEFQKIRNYFDLAESEIAYQGNFAHFKINQQKDSPFISLHQTEQYHVPKIMYVPAERNLLSIISDFGSLRNLPASLWVFASELRKTQLALKNKWIPLPIGDVKYKYDGELQKSFIQGTIAEGNHLHQDPFPFLKKNSKNAVNQYELELEESSSGFQSLIPMYLVSKFLAEEILDISEDYMNRLSADQLIKRNAETAKILKNTSLKTEEQIEQIKAIDLRYKNSCFINIVEEPEQNLFPTSQQKMLNSLLTFNQKVETNKLIITSHSPFLINHISLNIKAFKSYPNIESDADRAKLEEIVPYEAMINPDDLAIYEFDEVSGSISKLSDYKGIPSDENYLNNELDKTNHQFSAIQDLAKVWK